MANFAREHMLKYGWKEGKGLGKDENGITEALKPTLKFDNAGIGYTKHVNANWWEVLYNEAVQNVKVESCDNKVSLSVIDKNWDPTHTEKIKQRKYGNFLKTSILDNGCLVQDVSVKLEEEKTANDPIYIPLTDEQLYAACGGRTMHATARHGITLSGKLDRIAQQDKILDISDLYQSKTSLDVKNTMTHRKINVDSEKEESEHEDSHEKMSSPEIKNTVVKSKSTRKKHKRRINKLADQLNNCGLKESEKKKITSLDFAILLPETIMASNIQTQKKVDEKLGMSSDKLLSEGCELKCDYNLHMYKQSINVNETIKMAFEQMLETVSSTDKCKWDSDSDKQAREMYRNSESYPPLSKWEEGLQNIDIYPKSFCKVKRTRRKLNSKQKKKLHSAEKVIFKKSDLDEEMLKLKENHKFSKKQHIEEVKKVKFQQESSQSFFMSYVQPKNKIHKSSKEISLDSVALHKSKNKIQKNVYYHSKKMKHMEKVIGKLKDYVLTDRLNSVIKDLTAINITEEVNANVFKNKPTQTHLKPV